MITQLSPLVRNIEEPATLFMARRSRELKAQGRDIVDLSLGEPDQSPPAFALEAAHEAVNGPWHKYPPVNGFLDVREAIARKFKRDNGLVYAPDQIVVSTGAKQSVMNAVMALVGPGDEVVIPAPYWVTYAEQVRMSGGTPVLVKSTIEEDWKAPIGRIADAITPRTRLLIFSSPCNPSGSVLSTDELMDLAAIVAKHPGLYVLSDEIYEHIVFTGKHVSFASLPGMLERTITVNGLSKAFAMTGWRVGYCGAPLEIARACSKIQGQFTSGANSIAQRVTLACMDADPGLLAPLRADFLRRRDLLLAEMANVSGWRYNKPEGAFYLLPEVSSCIGRRAGDRVISNSNDLCMYLLEDVGVSLVDGSAFGAENTLRISYATADDRLRLAVERLAAGIAQLN
jgi:aspartate aminotransferase